MLLVDCVYWKYTLVTTFSRITLLWNCIFHTRIHFLIPPSSSHRQTTPFITQNKKHYHPSFILHPLSVSSPCQEKERESEFRKGRGERGEDGLADDGVRSRRRWMKSAERNRALVGCRGWWKSQQPPTIKAAPRVRVRKRKKKEEEGSSSPGDRWSHRRQHAAAAAAPVGRTCVGWSWEEGRLVIFTIKWKKQNPRWLASKINLGWPNFRFKYPHFNLCTSMSCLFWVLFIWSLILVCIVWAGYIYMLRIFIVGILLAKRKLSDHRILKSDLGNHRIWKSGLGNHLDLKIWSRNLFI